MRWSVLAVSVVLMAVFAFAGNSVDIIPKTIDSPLEDIQWVTDDVLLVLTEKGQLWRSGDTGKTWKPMADKLTGETESAAVKSIYVSPADKQVIFLLGSGPINWASHDQGVTFEVCQHDIDLHDVRLHPTQKTWLLGATMSPGCHDRESTVPCFKKLWHSKDLCRTWEESLTYVVQFDWSPPVGPADHDGKRDSDDLVYVTSHTVKEGAQRFGFWDKEISFFQSYDYFKTSTVLVPHGNRFLFGEHAYMFVAAVNPLHETEVQLVISRDNATTKLFQKAVLPVELTQHSYTVLDTSEGSVFVHVNHQPFSDNAATGHVYVSDASGLSYSLSLPYNHRSADGKCDFEKVEGLEGIYLANFIDEPEKEADEEEQEEMSPNADSDKPHRRHGHVKTKTVITFDKGGVWSYLDPPRHDSNGHAISCGSCHLHLHGITDMYGPFYSTATATGLIMATGSVSNYLQEDLDDINTFLSRDAGLTWNEVAKGSHIYEFGDHGALIVMANDNAFTDHVLYSWDQGHTWSPLKIADFKFQIENIIIEPTATSQVFVVYGWHEGSGVLVYLNFGSLHERECTGHDKPDAADSDYETWTPSDHRLGEKCLMGRRVKYTRRKAESACFNPDTHERSVTVDHCVCTKEDFECDYGYERHEVQDENHNRVLNGPCEKSVTPPVHKDPALERDCEDKLRVSRGYRRVAGDSCVGGSDQWDAYEVPCPGWIQSGKVGKIVLFVFVFIAVAVCAATIATRTHVLDKCAWFDRCRNRIVPYMPVDRQTEVGGMHDPEEHNYLNEEEFSRSAQLLSEGGSRKESSSGGGKKKDRKDSVASAQDPEDGQSLKPLPPAKEGAAVPALAPPKSSVAAAAAAAEEEEFNPRKNA